MSHLLPCPKCGTVEHLKTDDALRHDIGYEVWCFECGLYGPVGYTEQEAVILWNNNCRIREERVSLDLGCLIWDF